MSSELLSITMSVLRALCDRSSSSALANKQVQAQNEGTIFLASIAKALFSSEMSATWGISLNAGRGHHSLDCAFAATGVPLKLLAGTVWIDIREYYNTSETRQLQAGRVTRNGIKELFQIRQQAYSLIQGGRATLRCGYEIDYVDSSGFTEHKSEILLYEPRSKRFIPQS